MKKIYLIRHGATEGNESNGPQHDLMPLSDTGIRQTKAVSEHFKNISVDAVISSNMARAKQTADIIGECLKKKVVYSDLFQEIPWPFSEKDNFLDFKERTDKALEYISSMKEENIIVVTHGNFLLLLVAIMCFGSMCTAEQYNKMQEFFIVKNTGITTIKEKGGSYFLLTLNSHSHLDSSTQT